MFGLSEDEIIRNWIGNSIYLSISCNCYNQVQYIEQTLNGFLMQKTIYPFEVLVHDDCSTDGTVQIIKEYEKKYPHIIKPYYEIENQYQNGKPSGSEAWNFPRAKGKYLAVCEGDDYWIDENKIQMQIDFLEQNSEYGLVYTSAYQYNQVLNKIVGIEGTETSFQQLVTDSNYIQNLTACYRKDIYDKYVNDINPLEKDWLMGDYPRWIYMSYYSKIKYIDKVTCIYRILPNSASHFTDIDKWIRFRKSVYDIKKFYQDYFNIKTDLTWDESIYYVPMHFNKGHRRALKNYSLPVTGKNNQIKVKFAKCPFCFYLIWILVKIKNFIILFLRKIYHLLRGTHD